MARVSFTRNLERYVACPAQDVVAGTIREALEVVFAGNPVLRGYVLDDQGRLRRHMVVFLNGQAVTDRERLADPVGPRDEILVLQALSGG